MVAGVVVVGEDALDVADVAVLFQRLGEAVDGVAVEVLAHAGDHAVLLGFLHHVPGLG